VATGEQFADALTGGALVARAGGPILLTRQAALPDSVRTYLTSVSDSLATVLIFGGTKAVSEEVEAALHGVVTE
jgi:putative cell wall-binding protein